MMVQGIAQMPGFEESLRLLVSRERYAMADIAEMFGVSRERIRQLCERFGIVHPDGATVGLYCERVWDDRSHQFRPVSRALIGERKRRERRTAKRMDSARRLRTRQTEMLAAVLALRDSIGREPTWREMWIAVGGDPGCAYFNSCISFLNRWEPRTRRTSEKLADFRAASGIAANPRGTPGHVTARRTKTHCRRGHEFTTENTYLYTPRNGYAQRHCRACKTLRDNRVTTTRHGRGSAWASNKETT